MRRALLAELTKLRTVRSTTWLGLAVVASPVIVGAMAVSTLNIAYCSPEPPGCDEDITRVSLAGVYVSQAAAVVLGVLAASTEYGTRMIRQTLACEPRRFLVVAAKLAVVGATVLGLGSLGVLGALAVGRVILPRNGLTAQAGYPPLSLADGPTLRAAAGTVLYLALVALLSLGIGLALRDTAMSLAAALGLLFVLPILAAVLPNDTLRQNLLKYSPMSAGLAIQATKRLDALPIGPWPGLGVTAAYAAAAVITGAVLFRLRDA